MPESGVPSMDRELEKQPDESPAEAESADEVVIRSKPKVIYRGGSCEHHYADYDFDEEGYMNARCIKCPMGIRYKPEEAELKNGNLKKRFDNS